MIVNLQRTPKDKKASLVIHARCDAVMRRVMARLDLPIPPYNRVDTVQLHCSQSLIPGEEGTSKRRVTVRICDQHAQEKPPPMIATALICISKVYKTILSLLQNPKIRHTSPALPIGPQKSDPMYSVSIIYGAPHFCRLRCLQP